MPDAIAWGRLAERYGEIQDVLETCEANARNILLDLHPVQRVMVQDPAFFKSGRCPRGSGKSHGATGYAMHEGEHLPNRRTLIIGLTLKAAKENYWEIAPGGVQAFDTRYSLGLDISLANCNWRHRNGSVGFLAGAESAADLERLRGSKVEADLIIVDECKSFSPARLQALIQDILLPGLARRGGTLLLIGTPGSIPEGIFYEATCETCLRPKPGGRPDELEPTCIPFPKRNDPAYAGLEVWDEELEQVIPKWSLHTWTLQDNLNRPKLYHRALLNKKMSGWADDHPVWRRESLGEWVSNVSDLVYAYAACKGTGGVTWVPGDTKVDWGLPAEGGPWHLLLGMDFGYEDDFAMVVVAYGEHDRTLYHLWDFKENHLTFDEMVEEYRNAARMFGGFETVVADAGGLGKVLVESMASQGIPIIRAEKSEKYDHIELVNSDFHSGHLKIIPDGDLEAELAGLQWDLSKAAKEVLARTGKLRESASCPNHLCDALLYVWRYAYHAFATDRTTEIAKGSPEWWEQREAALKAAQEYNPNQDPMDARLRRHGATDHFAVPWRSDLKTWILRSR